MTRSEWGKWQLHERPGWVSPGYQDLSAYMALPPPQWWDNADLVETGDSRFVVSDDTLAAFEERRAWVKRNKPRGSDRFDPGCLRAPRLR